MRTIPFHLDPKYTDHQDVVFESEEDLYKKILQKRPPSATCVHVQYLRGPSNRCRTREWRKITYGGAFDKGLAELRFYRDPQPDCQLLPKGY